MIQNITIRVPWTDNSWCGKVCNHPCGNTDCLRLKNIYENKNETEYDNSLPPPAWMIFETTTFGTVSKIYSNIKKGSG